MSQRGSPTPSIALAGCGGGNGARSTPPPGGGRTPAVGRAYVAAATAVCGRFGPPVAHVLSSPPKAAALTRAATRLDEGYNALKALRAPAAVAGDVHAWLAALTATSSNLSNAAMAFESSNRAAGVQALDAARDSRRLAQ